MITYENNHNYLLVFMSMQDYDSYQDRARWRRAGTPPGSLVRATVSADLFVEETTYGSQDLPSGRESVSRDLLGS